MTEIFFSIPLLLFIPNPTYASDNTYCITKDSEGNIIYNKNSKNKCKLLKVLESNKKNELTQKGIENINGKPCILTSSNNYANAEDLSGITLSNGSTRTIRCNDGYAGDISIRCDNGTVVNEGEDNGCYKVVEVEYISPRNNNGTTKTFRDGESIKCHDDTFDIGDPDVDTIKVCKVNNFKL